VRAKGGTSETGFLARFNAHPLLGRALLETRRSGPRFRIAHA
jgi:hypothetical protein